MSPEYFGGVSEHPPDSPPPVAAAKPPLGAGGGRSARRASKLLSVVAAGGVGIGIAALAGGLGAQGNPLPAGRHMELVLGSCIICHSPEILAQQRLDRATWEVIVDRMITYGAPITRETRPLILEYLTTHLGPSG
jgi:hypothetical protein